MDTRYETSIPNMLLDLDISEHDIIFYATIKRIISECGVCNKGVRDLTEYCQCSWPTIYKSRKRLLDLGLIKITKTFSETGCHRADLIELVDITERNKQYIDEGIRKLRPRRPWKALQKKVK